MKLGEYRAQANKYSPALEALRRAQQIDPKEPGLDLALGVVHLGLLEVDEARAALERALAAEPDNLAALSSLAQACSKARDHAAARGYYQRLIDLGHRDAPYLLGLGAALLGLGENEAAIAALTSAAAANPELAEAHFHLARAYRAVGRAEDSQRELKTFQALKANPLQPFAERSDFERDLWRRAEALLVDGKEKAALELLAGGNVPGNQPEYLVGALYYKLGRYADAERLLSRALQAAPKLPKLRAYLGLALLEQGRVAEAEAGDPGGGRAEPARAVRPDGAGRAPPPQEGVEGGGALPAGVEGRRAGGPADAVRGAARERPDGRGARDRAARHDVRRRPAGRRRVGEEAPRPPPAHARGEPFELSAAAPSRSRGGRAVAALAGLAAALAGGAAAREAPRPKRGPWLRRRRAALAVRLPLEQRLHRPQVLPAADVRRRRPLDYDGDGKLDIFFTNGGKLPELHDGPTPPSTAACCAAAATARSRT